jgi:hypothetical protein
MDLTVRGLLDAYTWGNRQVKLYVGYGRDLANYTVDFHGIVMFPGGISGDRDQVHIKLRDFRNKDTVTIPANKYWTSDYPNLEEGAEGRPIPIVYGGTGGPAGVPCTCIDTTSNTFKVADHRIRSIVQVMKRTGSDGDWGPVAHANEDLANATFTLGEYDPDQDEVAAMVEGKCYSADIADYLWSPMKICRDILEEYMGVETANIDTDAMDDLAEELGSIMCARYIAAEISTDTLLEELAIENLFDLFIRDDQYTVRGRIPKVGVDRSFDAVTIAPGSLRVEGDPERLYANRVKCTYGYDPLSQEYLYFHQEDNLAAQTEAKQVIPRTIAFNWLYRAADVQAFAAHLIILYSHEIDVIQFTALGEGILTQLSDRIGLTFGHFTNRPLLVREISKHFGTMSCTIYGYDSIKHVLPGYWTEDTAPDFASATAEERKSQGFYTDDDGYAEPGNEQSKVSLYW